MRFIASLLGVFAFALAGIAPAAAAPTSIAVMNFSTQGLTGNWWGNFEPGVAISDLLTDQLVNGGGFSVVDRTQLDKTLAEHSLSSSGEVSPASAISSGRLIGARYLVTGNVVQFDRTSASGANAGTFIPGPVGVAVGGAHTDRVTLRVVAKIIDTTTGQIVQSISDEQSKSATSWSTGSFIGYAGGSYSNQQFMSSTMGQLINTTAADIAKKIDPSRFSSAPLPPALSGRVLAIDGANVIINIGSSNGVSVGQYFDVQKVLTMKDPSTGRLLTSHETIAKLQIVSVDAQTAIGRRLSGSGVLAGMVVQSE